ncbi:MAG: twin-arginine translocase TatA/TatE family subunit [Gluconacetobacter diazotrophicus]|nr:twin-arginine translocase TatA/TatE family subunit [Gluconacetobacter diazotrophicus]
MGSLSIWHWLIVLAVVLILFGGSSKISSLMGDFAKGIKSFKKNMADDESMEHGQSGAPAAPTAQLAQHQDPGYAQAAGYNPAPNYAQHPAPTQNPSQPAYQPQPVPPQGPVQDRR